MQISYEALDVPLKGNFRGFVSLSMADLVDLVGLGIYSDSGNEDYPNFIHVKDSRITSEHTPISLSRRDPAIRSQVTELAALGYLLYYSRDGEARFVHRDRIPSLWQPVLDGEIRVDRDGVYYTLETRVSIERVRRLIVVFSGVAARPSAASLYRYFEPNYRHLPGLTSADTAILRIADVGGVVGAFYSGTLDRPGNRLAVKRLIESVISGYGIRRDRVCLLGSSKGATGALLHGLSLGVPFVAVDPILSDGFYEESMNDAHFTSGSVFFESKQDLFARFADEVELRRDMFAGIFTSPQSEQCDLVTRFYSRLSGAVALYSSDDPRIDGHPAVAGSTLGLALTLVNSVIHNMPLRNGLYQFS